MSLTPGTRLGPYQIESALGAGGMGEVYRARDTKLGRDVAIKVLPDSVAGNSDRLARFEREAKVLAALNHPNIAHIHGFEDSTGVPALVMELVEGPTLADRIGRGPIPIDEALQIARQIAEALDAAHEQGIIHRDLKPANVKVRADGTVKVLDFGLAKAIDPVSPANLSSITSPTLTTPAQMTNAGVILGTAAYMSPEQVKSRPVDRRADVWAFGVVLYEMLTGRRCFPGDDMSDTLAAILRASPDWTALPTATPAAIRRLLRRSLEKDFHLRLSDMAMVRVEIREAETDSREGALVTDVTKRPASPVSRIAPYAAVVIAMLVTGGVVWRVRQPAEESRPLARFSIDPPEQTAQSTPGRALVAISPDGTHMAYSANQRLYLRALDQIDAVPIPGTEAGGIGGYARSPIFSPDGQWLAFWQQAQLKKVSVSGGAPVTVCQAASFVGSSWEPGGHILYASQAGGGIVWVPSTGGTPEVLVSMKDGERGANPQLLPGGQWLLFVDYAANASQEQGRAVVQSRTTGERRVLMDSVRDVRFVPSGHLVFGRGNSLLAQAFDPLRMTTKGGPVPVLDGVRAVSEAPGMHVALSSTGTLLYLPGSAVAEVPLTKLVQVTREGIQSVLADVQGMTWFPRFSPDGARVAYGVSASPNLNENADLWVLDLTRGARTRVTFSANNRFYPIWTPDGTRLTFADGTASTNRLLWALADGSGGLETLMDVGPRRFPTSWSPDGKVLALYMNGNSSTGPGQGSRDLWMLSRDGSKWTPKPFLQTEFEERGAIFSPNGRWVAYVSNKSGQNDVYARPFPGPGGEVTVSVGGGAEPVWARSGRELFYRHDGKLMSVRIKEAASSLTVDAPTRVFDDPYRLDTGGAQGGVANYDISPDGRRFVMIEEPRAAGGTTPTVRPQIVLNWFEELKARVPTK